MVSITAVLPVSKVFSDERECSVLPVFNVSSSAKAPFGVFDEVIRDEWDILNFAAMFDGRSKRFPEEKVMSDFFISEESILEVGSEMCVESGGTVGFRRGALLPFKVADD